MSLETTSIDKKVGIDNIIIITQHVWADTEASAEFRNDLILARSTYKWRTIQIIPLLLTVGNVFCMFVTQLTNVWTDLEKNWQSERLCPWWTYRKVIFIRYEQNHCQNLVFLHINIIIFCSWTQVACYHQYGNCLALLHQSTF